MPYNNLDSDLKALAKFVYIYETKIKFMTNEQVFQTFSNDAYNLFRLKIKPKIKYSTKDEIAIQNDFSRYTLFMTKRINQVLDLCRHLRNSISHALLKKDNSKPINFEIHDKYRGKETCKGFLPCAIIIDFIVCIIKDYES